MSFSCAAHDWTTDALAHLKGPGAQDTLAANVQLARELGLKTGEAPVASTASSPTTPASRAPAVAPSPDAADGTSSPEKLGKQLTDALLAQLKNAVHALQTQHGTAV